MTHPNETSTSQVDALRSFGRKGMIAALFVVAILGGTALALIPA